MPPVSLVLDQPLLYDCLGSNPGVIVTRQPEDSIPAHPLPSYQSVFEGDSQSVSDMQVSSDVWRGKDNTEDALRQGFTIFPVDRFEEAFLLPPVIMGGLNLSGVVAHKREITRDI